MKGFTLIELLAVIVILGIVILIAVPVIFDLIEQFKINVVSTNVKLLDNALDMYILNNTDKLPQVIGTSLEVSLDDLVSEGYIKPFQSPYNSSNCSGYVMLRKEAVGFTKTPYINCITDINNANEDGLLAHYAFDDFQEPTQNFVREPSVLAASRIQSFGFGDNSTHTNVSLVEGDLSGANIIKVTRKAEHNYMTAATTYIDPLVLTPGQKVTLSIFVKAGTPNVVGKTLHLHIYGTSSAGGNFSIGNSSDKLVGSEWQRHKVTLLNNSAANWTITTIYSRLNSGTLPNEEFMLISSPQLEKKGYETPYVSGIRAGFIKDYSKNGRDVSLSLNSTPKWIFNDARKSGAYFFDNNIIQFGIGTDFLPMSKFSISTWVKSSGLGSGMSLNGIFSLTYGVRLYLDATGKVVFRLDDGVASPLLTANSNLHDNKYHHIVAVFNGTERLIYIDGKLIIKDVFTGWQGTTRWPTNQVVIGQDNNNSTIYRFHGEIDDFRLYSRDLSSDEIKLMYELNK